MKGVNLRGLNTAKKIWNNTVKSEWYFTFLIMMEKSRTSFSLKIRKIGQFCDTGKKLGGSIFQIPFTKQ